MCFTPRAAEFAGRMSSTLNAVVVVVAVFACLLYTFPANAQSPTTCHAKAKCSSCTGDKVKILNHSSGSKIPVCCPGCSSKYFRYGSNWCDCDYVRVSGNASKGEECSAPGMMTFVRLNEMPICCAYPGVVVYRGAYARNHAFDCVVIDGDCWRGSQCASCDQGYVGRMYDVRFCCPNCEKRGLKLGPGSCDCNRNK